MIKEELFKKWLSDELSPSELKEFKKLDDFDLNNEIIDGAKHFKASHFSSVDNYEILKAKLNKRKTPVIKLNSYKILYRVAALFILSIGIYSLSFLNNLTTVQTLASQQTTFELPDASEVTLNASSKVTYSKKNWSNKREVSLNGEAFFKVAKGSKFNVITTNGTVSVVGTQFIVKSRDSYFEVKCFEGVVSVSSNGEKHLLDNGKTYRIINNKTTLGVIKSKEPKWLHNISSFKSVPLIEVLNEFERQYNITFESQQVDTGRLFTGGFVHNNLEQALISVTIPLDLSYKKDNSNKIILSNKK